MSESEATDAAAEEAAAEETKELDGDTTEAESTFANEAFTDDENLTPEEARKNIEGRADTAEVMAEGFGNSFAEKAVADTEGDPGLKDGLKQELGELNNLLLGAGEELKQDLNDIENEEDAEDLEEEIESEETIAEAESAAEKEEDDEVLKGEIVHHMGKWSEDLDPETIAWLEDENGPEEFRTPEEEPSMGQEFTDEEREAMEKILEQILAKEGPGFEFSEEFEEFRKSANVKDFRDALDQIEARLSQEQQEQNDEVMKLVIRIALRIGAKIAASLARQLARDKDLDPAVRYMFGMMAEGIDQGSKFVDQAIAGDSRANIRQETIDHIRGMLSKSPERRAQIEDDVDEDENEEQGPGQTQEQKEQYEYGMAQ